MIPSEQIAAIQARLAKITPGPWFHTDDYRIITGEGYLVLELDGFGEDSDAEFIASAPEDIAYLLAVIAEQQREIERLTKHQRLLTHPYESPAPSCLKCGKPMAFKDSVEFTDDKSGLKLTMSWALLCECGYRTVPGPLMSEFSQRFNAARYEAAEAALAQARQERDKLLTLPEGKPCLCGMGPCIGQKELREGYVCSRSAVEVLRLRGQLTEAQQEIKRLRRELAEAEEIAIHLTQNAAKQFVRDTERKQ